MPSHAQEVRALLGDARARHAELLTRVGPELRASLPVDATGMTQAIAHLAEATGTLEALEAQQAREHRANPAVLHGRVFGRAPLAADTVLAAFVDGARVRAALLLRLAEAVGGPGLGAEVAGVLEAAPLPADLSAPDAEAALRAGYGAQERAVLRIAARLDTTG